MAIYKCDRGFELGRTEISLLVTTQTWEPLKVQSRNPKSVRIDKHRLFKEKTRAVRL